MTTAENRRLLLELTNGREYTRTKVEQRTDGAGRVWFVAVLDCAPFRALNIHCESREEAEEAIKTFNNARI